MKGTERIKVLLVKPSLDGHWRGPAVVAAALRDAGMEVVYGGVMGAEETAAAAIQEDVDVIGLSIYGGHGIPLQLMRMLSERAVKPVVIAGGTISAQAARKLKEAGVDEVFPAGSSLTAIVDYVRERCGKS